MTELTEYVVELFSKIEAGVIDVAPAALDMVLAVVRVDAISALIGGLVAMVVGIVVGLFGRKLLRESYNAPYRGSEDWKEPVGMICSLIPIATTIGFLATWFNIWNWIAVFQPELALAKQIIEMVVK